MSQKPLDKRLAEAVRHYWKTRLAQDKRQGARAGRKDQGNRAAVTGGAQLDGFVKLMRALLAESGIPDATIHTQQTVIPGFFRPTKEWDLVAVVDGNLFAGIEFKSQAGPSYGNNFNNRVEEALGSATDLWIAYREGAFKPSQRPWLGYFMLLEDEPRSTSPVSVQEPHFKVFEEFRDASYAKRYQLFCERLVRERLYDATCFLLSDRKGGLKGSYSEPAEELNFRNFAISLTARAEAYVRQRV
ncbi:MAG: PaeR7I family type II restriction endonuclease [Betaproteobacteria bacterium]|nr:PaeR7I family type II restriction endonuclease [Betaproteobacteria bacterium]